jgi:hypothetical protein
LWPDGLFRAQADSELVQRTIRSIVAEILEIPGVEVCGTGNRRAAREWLGRDN